MTSLPGLPPWPARPVAHGPIVLRKFSYADVPMAMELATDPYVPTIGSGCLEQRAGLPLRGNLTVENDG
jgi:hypothetical protein